MRQSLAVKSIILCLLLTGCATTHSTDGVNANPHETDTQRGVRYLLGRGVAQSYDQAFYYFSQAADHDDPVAQNEVAYLYAVGKGTAQDNSLAFKYYQKAANHGLASAQYNVGFFYLHGIGVAQDTALAKSWFDRSASHGFEPAKVALLSLKN